MAHGILKNQDNTIAVVHLSPEALKMYEQKGLTHDEAVEEEINKLQSRGDLPKESAVVGKNLPLPANREFRNAWAWITEDPVVDIDPVKAVEVTKERLRAERAPLLAALDVEFMRASEAQDAVKMAAIAAKKQTLRDVTSTVPTSDKPVADEEFLNQLRAVKVK